MGVPARSAARLARGGDRLHEQLGELRGLVGEPADLARRAGPGQQPVQVDRLVDEKLDPVAVAFEDRGGAIAVAVEPAPVGTDDLDLEVPSTGRAP